MAQHATKALTEMVTANFPDIIFYYVVRVFFKKNIRGDAEKKKKINTEVYDTLILVCFHTQNNTLTLTFGT